MPLVSVVMPVFNAADTLKRAIRSTLWALPRDGEIVLIDDGSRDSTLEVAHNERSRDKRIRIIEHKENSGIVSALNAGIAYGDSKYIARMDADDISLPWRMTQAFHSLQHEQLDIVFATIVSFRSWRSFRPARPTAISPDAMRLNLLLINPVAHSTMVGLRESIVSAGGYREVPSEDYDLWLRATAADFRIGRLAMPGLLYRRHPDQITARDSWKDEAAKSVRTAEAHQALCRQVLNVDFRVYNRMRSGQFYDDDIRMFLEAVRQSAECLSIRERAHIRRRIDIISQRTPRESLDKGA